MFAFDIYILGVPLQMDQNNIHLILKEYYNQTLLDSFQKLRVRPWAFDYLEASTEFNPALITETIILSKISQTRKVKIAVIVFC